MKSKLFLGLLAIILLASSSNGFCGNESFKEVRPYRDGTTVFLENNGNVVLVGKTEKETKKINYGSYSYRSIEVEGLDILAIDDELGLWRFNGHTGTKVFFSVDSSNGWTVDHFVEEFYDHTSQIIELSEKVAVGAVRFQRTTNGELEILLTNGKTISYAKEFK